MVLTDKRIQIDWASSPVGQNRADSEQAPQEPGHIPSRPANPLLNRFQENDCTRRSGIDRLPGSCAGPLPALAVRLIRGVPEEDSGLGLGVDTGFCLWGGDHAAIGEAGRQGRRFRDG